MATASFIVSLSIGKGRWRKVECFQRSGGRGLGIITVHGRQVKRTAVCVEKNGVVKKGLANGSGIAAEWGGTLGEAGRKNFFKSASSSGDRIAFISSFGSDHLCSWARESEKTEIKGRENNKRNLRTAVSEDVRPSRRRFRDLSQVNVICLEKKIRPLSVIPV